MPLAEAALSQDVTAVLDDLRRIVRALRESSRAAEREIGLSGAQLFVLRTLSRADRALSLNALAERTKTHQSSVSVVVTRLVRRRLVSRRKSDVDARRLEVALTGAGRALLEQAPGSVQDQLIRGVERLPGPKRRALAAALRGLVVSMQLDDRRADMFFESDDERPARRKRK
jgi:DNA-binding MarR family transcriptional regulator